MNSDLITSVSEYTAWTETVAVYPRDDSKRAFQYVFLGFLSEIGEICGMLKREIRDPEYTLERLNLKLELGDVAWYLARIQYNHEHDPDDSENFSVQKMIKQLSVQPENMSCFEVSRAIWEDFKEIAKSRTRVIEFLLGKNLKEISGFEELGSILEKAHSNLSEEDLLTGTTIITMCEMYSMAIPKLIAMMIEHCQGTLGVIGFYILCDRFRFAPLEIMKANFTKLEDRKQRDKLHGNGDNR